MRDLSSCDWEFTVVFACECSQINDSLLRKDLLYDAGALLLYDLIQEFSCQILRDLDRINSFFDVFGWRFWSFYYFLCFFLRLFCILAKGFERAMG